MSRYNLILILTNGKHNIKNQKIYHFKKNKNKNMDILTEENKKHLSTYHQVGLTFARVTITELSSSYNLQASKIYKDNGNKPNEKFFKLQGISSNLLFCTVVIDKQIEINNSATKEINGLKAKFYELHKAIDSKNEEIKRLKKINEELKKNINL